MADLNRDAAILRGDAIGEATLARMGGEDSRATSREAEEDAALARIDAEYGVQDDDDGEPGQAAPQPLQQAPTPLGGLSPAPPEAPAGLAPTPATEPTIPPAPGSPQEAPGGPQTAEQFVGQVDMLSRARAALQRDGVPESAYKDLPPADLMQWGLAAHERQSKADDSFRQLNERLQGLEAPQDQSGPAAEQKPANPDEVTLEGVFEPLVDLFGDDAGEHLKGLIGRVEERYAAQLAQRDQIIDQGRQEIEKLSTGLTQMQVSAARQNLQTQMPQLRDENTWKGVIAKGHELAQSGQYTDMNHLLSTAVDVLYGAQARQALAQQQASEQRAAQSGQPTPVTGGRVAQTTASPNGGARYFGDVESDILEAIPRYGADSPQVRALQEELARSSRGPIGDDEPMYFRR